MNRQANPAWTLVESSAISAIAYDEAAEVLFVRFHKSGEYAYENVTKAEHAGLTTAGSLGQYFNQVIKPGHTARKVELEPTQGETE